MIYVTILFCSRQAGHRFGSELIELMPELMIYVTIEDDELREHCISAFEAFVLRCPQDISPSVPQILEICLRLLTHDPNYNYDDYDEEDNGSMDMDDDEEEQEDDEYSDDDDMSWKVRRASAKCIEAIVSTRNEMLLQFYTTVSPQLIARFKGEKSNLKMCVKL